VIHRRTFLLQSGAALAALLLPRASFAQTFPSRPIKIIVPFPPGGPADTAVRIPQASLEKALGQPIVIENVAGAAGQVGAMRVKQSEPDGHTLLQAASPHTTNAAVKPDAYVDLLRDFTPIGETGNSVYTLCASKELGVQSFAEMVARAKAKPGELKIGSVGIGTSAGIAVPVGISPSGSARFHPATGRPWTDDQLKQTREAFNLAAYIQYENAPIRTLGERWRKEFDPRDMNTNGVRVPPGEARRVLALIESHDVVWVHTLKLANAFR